MRRTSTIILAAVTMALLSAVPGKVYSQNKSTAKQPTWITKAPNVKNTYVGIASVSKRSMNPDGEEGDNSATAQQASSIIVSQLFFNDKYKENGKKEAQKKILASLHLAVDANSLLGDLILKGAYTSSFDDVFIGRVLNTPLLKFQGEWENDEEYWCYYSITEKDYQTRITQLEDSICSQAETMWKLGMSYQQDGLLFTAAKTYTEALNLIHPLIYTQHRIKYDFENVDLFSNVFDFAHVIEWYEDGGAPFTFSVYVSGTISEDMVNAAVRTMSRIKPVEAVLDEITFIEGIDSTIIMGGAIRPYRYRAVWNAPEEEE